MWNNLLILWLSQFISQIGDFVFYTVLIFLVLNVEKVNASFKAGFVSFLETLPFFIFPILFGPIIDRNKKIHVMILSDISRAIILLLFWPLYFSNKLNFITIGILAFSHTTFSTLFTPALNSLIPIITPKGQTLTRANALVLSSQQISMVLGAFLAALIVGKTTTEEETTLKILYAITFDVITFVISFLLLTIIKVDEKINPSKLNLKDLVTDVHSGLNYVKNHKFIKRLLIITLVDNLFIMGPAVVGANLLVKNYFNLGARELAIFEGFMSLGWLLGILFLYFHNPKNHWNYLVFGIFMDGFTYLPFGFLRSFEISLIFIFLHGFFIPFITVMRTSMIQEHVKGEFHGRIFSLVHLTVTGAMSLSSLFTGFLGEYLPPNLLFFIPGVLGSLTGILSYVILPNPKDKKDNN